jgi:hypothetical protein
MSYEEEDTCHMRRRIHVKIVIYVNKHTCVHTTYIPTCMRTYIHTCMRTYMHAYVYTCIHAPLFSAVEV